MGVHKLKVEIDGSLIIQVHNKGWEDVTVSVSARPFFKLFEGNIVFFWAKWLWSSFSTTVVCPGRKKAVSKVTTLNIITHKLGGYRWRLYNISVAKSGGCIAKCTTPLHCTWIVEDRGIIQEDDPENRCEFEKPLSP
ncbi:UNVERIFIED_CONTAM: hypothetical protein K2H54_023445 [Gekko kuhli]